MRKKGADSFENSSFQRNRTFSFSKSSLKTDLDQKKNLTILNSNLYKPCMFKMNNLLNTDLNERKNSINLSNMSNEIKFETPKSKNNSRFHHIIKRRHKQSFEIQTIGKIKRLKKLRRNAENMNKFKRKYSYQMNFGSDIPILKLPKKDSVFIRIDNSPSNNVYFGDNKFVFHKNKLNGHKYSYFNSNDKQSCFDLYTERTNLQNPSIFGNSCYKNYRESMELFISPKSEIKTCQTDKKKSFKNLTLELPEENFEKFRQIKKVPFVTSKQNIPSVQKNLFKEQQQQPQQQIFKDKTEQVPPAVPLQNNPSIFKPEMKQNQELNNLLNFEH